MAPNNDDNRNAALTGEGEVSFVDKGFIWLKKGRIIMEKGSGVLKDATTACKIMGVEDSEVMKGMEQAESKLNVAIFLLKLLEKQDSNVIKVIILLIILFYIGSKVIPLLPYFI